MVMIIFFTFFPPNIIIYVLNIARTMKKMSVNELRDLSLRTIINELDLIKKEVIIQ